ncbi:MAG: metallophosphoesterase [Rhizobiales bacterium]|nr:metallophosphoesterase [Hyphomicrobiales bacterium]
MITRRKFLKRLGQLFIGGIALGGYSVGIEPMRLRVQNYNLTPPRWPADLRLKVAALADIHACRPWMSPERIRYIVEATNALEPDIIVLLGDYSTGHPWVTEYVHSKDWSKALTGLNAPLGTHAIMGNHDWWEDRAAQRRGAGPVFGHVALQRAGIPVYENHAARLEKDGRPFWLAGLGDQLALLPYRRYGRSAWQGADDLYGTLNKITDDAPVILMAHEPDIFPRIPDRVSLTLAGHTHGGQVRMFGYSPVVPSRYRNRYAYGHIIEHDADMGLLPRHMVVSGGLGNSIMPVRLGVPPEIVVLNLGGTET